MGSGANPPDAERYLIEEAYEVLEAVDSGDPALLAEELGDVLLQVVFHAQIARELGTFTMDDVIDGICEKLIRRHPHVFADTEVESVGDVMRNWEAIKSQEKHGQARTSILDGVPKEFPALMRAEKIQKKAAKVGFEWDDVQGAFAKVEEELQELRSVLTSADRGKSRTNLAMSCLPWSMWRGMSRSTQSSLCRMRPTSLSSASISLKTRPAPGDFH